MLKVSDLNYRAQNDFRPAIVSAEDLEFGPILCTKKRRNSRFHKIITGLCKPDFGELFKAMWIAIPKIFTSNPESES